MTGPQAPISEDRKKKHWEMMLALAPAFTSISMRDPVVVSSLAWGLVEAGEDFLATKERKILCIPDGPDEEG